MLRKRALFFLLIVGFIATSTNAQTKQPYEEPLVKAGQYKKPANPYFIRLQRNKTNNVIGLQTPIIVYVPINPANGRDVEVHMIGAVHVGDPDYYKKLDKLFDKYDALLYELVAAKGKKPTPNRKDPLYYFSKYVLDLETQTNRINYRGRKNFIHADLSPNELQAAMKKRGLTGFALGAHILADFLQQQQRAANEIGKNNGGSLILEDIIDPNRGLFIKNMMAKQLASSMLSTGRGGIMHKLLIADRNIHALKVMKKQLDAGKEKIGIFYGAAHLRDFDEQMYTKYGFKRKQVIWLNAWDLSKPTNKTPKDDLTKAIRLGADILESNGAISKRQARTARKLIPEAIDLLSELLKRFDE